MVVLRVAFTLRYGCGCWLFTVGYVDFGYGYVRTLVCGFTPRLVTHILRALRVVVRLRLIAQLQLRYGLNAVGLVTLRCYVAVG